MSHEIFVCLCFLLSFIITVCIACVLYSNFRRFAASSNEETVLEVRLTVVLPTRVTVPWLTPATTRSLSAWTTSRAAALVRSANTFTPQPTYRPKLRLHNTRPIRRLWPPKLLPQLQPWWEQSTFYSYYTQCARRGREIVTPALMILRSIPTNQQFVICYNQFGLTQSHKFCSTVHLCFHSLLWFLSIYNNLCCSKCLKAPLL